MPESRPGLSSRRRAPQPRETAAPAWSEALATDDPRAALTRIGEWLHGRVVELSLTSPDGSTLARWRHSDDAPSNLAATGRLVDGSPDWRLAAVLAPGTPDAERWLDRAATALEVWLSARPGIRKAERDVERRAAELQRIQLLGRKAAEARSPTELFASAVAVLERQLDLDLILASYRLDGVLRVEAFRGCALDASYVDAAVGRAVAFLGAKTASEAVVRLEDLDTFDAARVTRESFRDDELVLLPLLRRDRPTAALVVVPAAEADEAWLRLLYNAANQLSLHLDRILTVREAEAGRFRSIAMAMPQGIVVADRALEVVQINESARRMLASIGLGPRAPLGEIIDRLELGPSVEAVLAGASPMDEAELRPGERRIWTATCSPLRDEEGGVDGLVLVLAEVTDSRRIQERLAQSEKLSSLGQMISGVAHELNNPLASILGYAQLLRPSGEGKVAERLELLGREAERCRRIVQNLLSFARWREPECRALSLNQCVQNVVALMAYQMRVDNVDLRAELSPDLPPLNGDAHQLEQVLVNLLSNARQAIRRGGGSGTVVVRTRVEGSRVVLEVEDDGPGVPESISGRIFEPFFTTKEPGQGTGLGLSLVHGIVTAHGATIDLASTPGPGATFRLEFAAGGRDVRHEPPRSMRPDRPAPSARILVVDDDEPVARVICETLALDGHHAERARSGDEALARLAQQAFDLVISDLRMPGMGGDRLHEELAKVDPSLARRLLLTTGDTLGEGLEEDARRTGAEPLHKPFDLAELRDRVRARLGER